MNFTEELSINLIDKCSSFLIGLRNLIDSVDTLLNRGNYADPIHKWNATIKKITPDVKACTINLKPKFNENDDFYLLFQENIKPKNQCKSFKTITNFEDINDLIANNTSLEFIDEHAKQNGYGNIKDNWNIIYIHIKLQDTGF